MGGKPGVAVNHYRGYSKGEAWKIFYSLPYHEMRITGKDGKKHYIKSDGTYQSALNEQREHSRSAYQRRVANIYEAHLH